MHTRVGWWSPQSIVWYERASSRTDFHHNLVDAIEPCLEKGDSILEPGCGLGYESEILSRRGYRVRAMDRDPSVIEAARARTGLDIYSCKDFSLDTQRPDVLLCVNFGHIDSPRDLDLLLGHAGRRLVYVVSKHSGHGLGTRADRSDLIKSLVTDRGLVYERRDLALQFDQPLRDMDEAKDFIDWTYLGDSTDRYMGFVEIVDDELYPFVFRNRKMMTLFSIDNKEK